jgi:hypothetical protein
MRSLSDFSGNPVIKVFIARFGLRTHAISLACRAACEVRELLQFHFLPTQPLTLIRFYSVDIEVNRRLWPRIGNDGPQQKLQESATLQIRHALASQLSAIPIDLITYESAPSGAAGRSHSSRQGAQRWCSADLFWSDECLLTQKFGDWLKDIHIATPAVAGWLEPSMRRHQPVAALAPDACMNHSHACGVLQDVGIV